MRKLYFLLPGTGGKYACGGLWAELKTLKLAQSICDAEAVTYRQREPNTLFLDDVLRQPHLEQTIFVVSWGFDIAKLVKRLNQYHVVYHAHSAGYGFNLPSQIPIITVSRNSLGYWGQRSPHALIYYLPNQISTEFQNLHLMRDIDVLVQARKSSTYLLNRLIPALQQHCNVFTVQSYVEDLPGLFNRAKVYLYDSAEYWAQRQVSEGFGLQPMEALACGCQIFSSINGGLSDYLDPGFNCQKIAGYATEFDVQRILLALKSPLPPAPDSLFAPYRDSAIVPRLTSILTEINEFFDFQKNHPATIPPLTSFHLNKLKIQQIFAKVSKKRRH